MSYNEKQLTADFSKWRRKNKDVINESTAYEFKVCKTKTLNIKRDFQDQQIPMLQTAKRECIYKKLSDMDFGIKPFDAMQICKVKYAYVGILWYKPRRQKILYLIDVDKIVNNETINEDEAKIINNLTIRL
jgi:hypothetical protein